MNLIRDLISALKELRLDHDQPELVKRFTKNATRRKRPQSKTYVDMGIAKN